MLVSEEFTRAAIARLYFVQNQDGIRIGAYLTQFLQEPGIRNANSPYTLNTFYYHSAYISFCQLCFKCINVVQRQEGNVPIAVHRGRNRRIIGHFNG